jgi:hypothetical protein
VALNPPKVTKKRAVIRNQARCLLATAFRPPILSMFIERVQGKKENRAQTEMQKKEKPGAQSRAPSLSLRVRCRILSELKANS